MTTPAPDSPGVYAPRGTLLRGAWAYLDDLDERRREKLSDDEWLPLLLAASELLYAYSGRLWAGVWSDEAVLDERGQHGGSHRPVGLLRPDPTRRRHRHYVVRLPGDPVVEVEQVQVQGATLGAGDYVLHAPNRLVRLGSTWRLDGSTVIRFRHGATPPESAVQAVLTYAYELGRARSSDKGCRLPESVQTVTRQGISYTTINRANGAEAGRTGLPEVDQWLESVNPLVGGAGSRRPRRAGAEILSPDLPPIARMIARDPEQP